MTTFLNRNSDYPVEKLILERWSPRAFTGDSIPHETLMSIFEAARWSPSSYKRATLALHLRLHGTPAFEKILGLLIPYNQDWAKHAAVLLIAVSKTTMSPRGTEMPNHSHSFDTGAAWQSLSLQATALGWHTHGMVGFDIPRAAQELGVPEGYRVEAAIAIGKQADKSVLPEALQEREVPSDRNKIETFAFEGHFPAA